MKHLFLSYSRTDSELMHRVRDTLRGKGMPVWTDESLTPGTADWSDAIERAIEGASAVVVLLSPDAKKSQWVGNELKYARAYDVQVFPILGRGEKEREAVPIELFGVQRVDIRTHFTAPMQSLLDELLKVQTTLAEEVASGDRETRELSDSERERLKFWTMLLERSKDRTRLFSNVSPRHQSWLGTSAGKTGAGFSYGVNKHLTSVELYIDFGQEAINKTTFDSLYSQKDQIEADFGEPLEWERLDHRRASRIIKRFYDGGLDTPELWPELQDHLIDAMIQFDKIFRDLINSIKI